MSLQFDLLLDRERYVPGDIVRGQIVVRQGGSSRSVSVVLEYHERTPECEAVVEQVSSGPIHIGDLATGQSLTFELALPTHALPNCVSPHGALQWQIDVWSDRRGPDGHERRVLVVDATP